MKTVDYRQLGGWLKAFLIFLCYSIVVYVLLLFTAGSRDFAQGGILFLLEDAVLAVTGAGLFYAVVKRKQAYQKWLAGHFGFLALTASVPIVLSGFSFEQIGKAFGVFLWIIISVVYFMRSERVKVYFDPARVNTKSEDYTT